MQAFRELLACPACEGPLSTALACYACGASFGAPDGIPDLRLPADSRTEIVRQFYERTPFPAYARGETLASLRARAGRSAFVQLLDRAVPGDARIVDIGCGTGQMSLYLARADRVVIGADLARASLRLGAAAAARFGLDRVQFLETDLQHPGLRARSFDLVYSSGVLHHTANPRAAFARAARLARPGGFIVVGVYNAIARIPSRIRRLVARLSALRLVPFDAVAKERRLDRVRSEAWLRDQYQHPEEHCFTVRAVKQWFAENGVDYLRAYPSVLFGDEPDDLFTRAADDWWVEEWLSQAGWIWTLGREGGLFFCVGQQRSAPNPQACSEVKLKLASPTLAKSGAR